MKPAPFAYHVPTGLDDALRVLAESTAAALDAQLLAGLQCGFCTPGDPRVEPTP